MSFREKSAWVTLIAILLVAALFFLHVPWFKNSEPNLWMLHNLFFCMVMFIIIEIVAHIVLYIRFPKDAQTPMDEREQLIELKATRIAAYVYVVGSFIAVSMIHLGADGAAVGYGVLLAFVIAEVVNYAMQIYYYRRGV